MTTSAQKESAVQHKWLTTVIVILVGTFALWFAILLYNAQHDLNYIATQLRADEITIRKPTRQQTSEQKEQTPVLDSSHLGEKTE